MSISKILNFKQPESKSDKITQLKNKINSADAVVIGAGAGLSTSAGFIYTGERFHNYFKDFSEKYEFNDMYSGGFYPYDTMEEHWAYWSRYIYVNRYMNPPKPIYDRLFELVKDKDYFVLTTNVDHCFQKAGFDKHRLFYTQGDYGLFQCSKPCHEDTYDNGEMVQKMVESQGFEIDENGTMSAIDKSGKIKMTIPTELVPRCPKCGELMTMNLRSDDKFVEDEGWHIAAERFDNFINSRKTKHIVYLELGVGYNTPSIIKYPFWRLTMDNPNAVYACVNYGEAVCPREIEKQSICIDSDIGDVI
jgi:NAD-dependent SIR2 family protein deacetylase